MKPEVFTAEQNDLPFIKNLVPYYIYDMSEFMGWGCNEKGLYGGCDDLEDYWEKENHYPYIIKNNNKVIGFSMIRPNEKKDGEMEIGEFFILRTYKSNGFGFDAAVQLFNKFEGDWLVRVLQDNTGAMVFWEKVIQRYSNDQYKKTNEIYECEHSGNWKMIYFRFKSNLC